MSSYDQQAKQAETEQQQQRGNEAMLSPEERKQLQRLMGFPSDYPRALGPWIREYLAVNPPDFSDDAVAGGRRFSVLDKNLDVVAGDGTSETTVYTAKIPAGSIGTFGQLQVQVAGLVSCNDADNTLTARIKLAGTTVITIEGLANHNTLDGTQRPWFLQGILFAAGSKSFQFMTVFHGHVTTAGGTLGGTTQGISTVDMSEDVDLTVTMQWTGAGTQNLDKNYASVIASKMAG